MKLPPDKMKLERLSEEHQKALESELEIIGEKGKKIAINVLLVAGGLALSYLLFKVATEGSSTKTKKKDKNDDSQTEQEPSFLASITHSLAKEAAIALLALAKDKLTEYLQKGLKEEDENTSGSR